MSELGHLLKKARTEKDLSLDDLESSTKIRKRYLEAIEEGNYKILPGNFYVKAFIKSYAEAVGLDPDEVVALYRSVIPSAQPSPAPEPLRRSKPKRVNMERVSKFASGFFMVAFLLLICGLIYYYLVNHANHNRGQVAGDNNPPITAKQADAGSSPSPGGSASPSKDSANSKPTDTNLAATSGSGTTGQSADAGSSGGSSPSASGGPATSAVNFVQTQNGFDIYNVTGSKTIKIDVKATGECWLEILKRSGGKDIGYIAKNVSMSAGDTKEWTADSSVHIHVGRANAVQITVNGQSINTGDTPNPKHFLMELQTASGSGTGAGTAAGTGGGTAGSGAAAGSATGAGGA